MQKHKIVILIPCFNEEKTIINICKRAKKFGHVFVVDDKSRDNSKKLLKKEKIDFKQNKINLGYERSLIEGFKFIIKKFKRVKYILTLDADGELPVDNIPKILNTVKKKDFDLVIGKRKSLNRLSENLLDLIFRLKFGYKDPVSGFKLYKIASLKKIVNKISNSMFLVDVPVIFLKLNLRVANINISTTKRIDSPRVGNSLKSNLKILRIVYKILH